MTEEYRGVERKDLEEGEELGRKATWNHFAIFVSDFHALST